MRILIFLFLFTIHGNLYAQPDPLDMARDNYQIYSEKLLENPKDDASRLHRAEMQIFLEYAGNTFYESSVLDNLTLLIAKNASIENYSAADFYQLRGDYKSNILNDFEGAFYDYMQVLYLPPNHAGVRDLNEINLNILESFCRKNALTDPSYKSLYNTLTSHRDNQEINLYKTMLRSFLLYKNEVIQCTAEGKISPNNGYFYFLVNAIYDLAEFYYANEELERSKNLLEKLMGLLPRDEKTNYFDFEGYAKIYELTSKIYRSEAYQNDELCLDYLLLYIGSPIGQTQALDAETLTYLNAMDTDNPKWNYILAIHHIRNAYYHSAHGNDREASKKEEFEMAQSVLENLDSRETNNYLFHYLKSILYFEFEGETQLAFQEINTALRRNQSDFFVFEYKGRIMRLTNDYNGKITVFDSALSEKQRKEREENALQSHEFASMIHHESIREEFILEILKQDLVMRE